MSSHWALLVPPGNRHGVLVSVMKEDMKKILAMSQFYGTSQCERKCKGQEVVGTDRVGSPSLGFVVLAEISLKPGQVGTAEDTGRGGGGVE